MEPTRETEGKEAFQEVEESLPSWLLLQEDYVPEADHDGFIRKSIASVAGVLSHMRLDGGVPSSWSPAAPVKMLIALLLIVLVSCAQNYLFVLVLLAAVLVRIAVLPAQAMGRAFHAAGGAALLTFLVMLPAMLLGQSHSALLIGTKVFVSVGIALVVALTTPAWQLTAALRAFHIPNIFILTVELTLKSIVDLGKVALEVLSALQMRSVGRNRRKGSALGGVGGVVLLKAQEAAQDTADAMRCRGFEGEYAVAQKIHLGVADALWCVAAAAACILFFYLEAAL